MAPPLILRTAKVESVPVHKGAQLKLFQVAEVAYIGYAVSRKPLRDNGQFVPLAFLAAPPSVQNLRRILCAALSWYVDE